MSPSQPSSRSQPLRLAALRRAVLVPVVLGAVLVPAASAFADDVPSPEPSSPSESPKPPSESPKPPSSEPTSPSDVPSPCPTGNINTEDDDWKGTCAIVAGEPSEMPKGGVAAGELPASSENTSGSTATLVGAATGAVLLAGGVTFVIRRRSGDAAARRNG